MTTQPDRERRAFYEQVRAANRDNPDPVIRMLLEDEDELDQIHESLTAVDRGEKGIPARQVEAEARARREREFA